MASPTTPSLIGGTTVTVLRPVADGADPHGNARPAGWEEETVAGVLPQPGGTDSMEPSRPRGVTVAMTFHFPKGYGRSLRGCRVRLDGREYAVMGDPRPYREPLVPGPWSMAVDTEAADG